MEMADSCASPSVGDRGREPSFSPLEAREFRDNSPPEREDDSSLNSPGEKGFEHNHQSLEETAFNHTSSLLEEAELSDSSRKERNESDHNLQEISELDPIPKSEKENVDRSLQPLQEQKEDCSLSSLKEKECDELSPTVKEEEREDPDEKKKKNAGSGLTYKLDDNLPIPLCLLLGFQVVLVGKSCVYLSVSPLFSVWLTLPRWPSG